MKRKRQLILCVIGILVLAFAAGCRKKVPVAAAPPPAPPAAAPELAKPNAPSISVFAAEPGQIERGQSAQLRWEVKEAAQIEINQGVGSVPASGSRAVAPTESKTYTLVATGPGGTAQADAALNVTAPPPPPPPTVTPPPPAATIGERLAKEVQDAYFDFDKSSLREDTRSALTRDAEALKTILADFPDTTVVLEGHCDERGSAEYNMALGDRRASSAKDFVTGLGVPADRVMTISYGKEKPQCTESNEECWQKNRRVHFVPGEKSSPKATSEEQKPASGADATPADRD